MLEEELLEIYVDGSVRNEKAGIVGITREINSNGEEIIKELFSREFYNAKSSEVEILACAYALEEVDRSSLALGKKEVIVYSDYQPLVDGYKTMAHYIGKNISFADSAEWKKVGKQREIYFQKYRIRVQVKKVAAHRNDIYNNYADALAKNIVRQPMYASPKPTSILSPRIVSNAQKTKSQLSKVMKIKGQRVIIRIHRCEYWKKKNWIYRYEFYSRQNKSWVYAEHKIKSQLSLDQGKIYFVTVNTDQNQPRILEANEVEKAQLSSMDISE